MSEDNEKSGMFTISGPWWVGLMLLGGAGLGGVGAEFVPAWLGKESTVSLSPESGKKIDSLVFKVNALSGQLRNVSRELDQLTGDFGDLASITARMDRISTHLSTVDRRVRALEENAP